MPKAAEVLNQTGGIAVMLVGPAGAGKTLASLSFPRCFIVGFDPTGLDVLNEPRNALFKKNAVWIEILNGLPLDKVFACTVKPSFDSLYGCIASAVEMKARGEIDTLVLDGVTYLSHLKEQELEESLAANLKPGKYLDKWAVYRGLKQYLQQFFLQDLWPLAPRHGLNVVVTCHMQRESVESIEGVDDDGERKGKRQLDKRSDLAPQISGGFRHIIDGMPSAMIYLDHAPEVLKIDGADVESIVHTAYTKKCFVAAWDTQVKAKNRYGLPARLVLTDRATGKSGSLYKTIQQYRNIDGSADRAAATVGANPANAKPNNREIK